MKTIYLTAALLFAGVAHAGPIRIGHPYSHPTAAPGVPGVGFLTISNEGKKADRLLTVQSADVEHIEMHMSQIKDGVMQMRALPKGLAVPAGKTVAFGPGGLHLMLFGLKAPLVEGASVPITLQFERAGAVQTVLKVEPRAPEPVEEHSGHSH